MGCSSSQQTEPAGVSSNHNMFKVTVLDSRGQDSCTGQLEITFQELILYQKGKEPIRWPLRGLRRYGCDKDLFSFESGRRCPGGAGIYAFRCNQAGALFNLLQVSILWAGQSQENRLSTISTSNPAVNPAVLDRVQETLEETDTASGAKNHNYINDPASLKYYNVAQELPDNVRHLSQYADLDLPYTNDDVEEERYVSNDRNTVTKKQTENSTQPHAYVNVSSGSENKPAYVNVPENLQPKVRAYVNVPASNQQPTFAYHILRHRTKGLDLRRCLHRGFSFENNGYLDAVTANRAWEFPMIGGDGKTIFVAGDRRSLALPPSQNFCVRNDFHTLQADQNHSTYAAIDFDKKADLAMRRKSPCNERPRKICHSCDVEMMYYC